VVDDGDFVFFVVVFIVVYWWFCLCLNDKNEDVDYVFFLEAVVAGGKRWWRFPRHGKLFRIQPWLFGHFR